MTRFLPFAIFGAMMLFVWLWLMPSAQAATVWTQQAGTFHWYKQGTANRYLYTTDINIPSGWVKQAGVYIQCKSTGGSNKYYQQGYDCNGKQTEIVVAPTCPAFVCKDDFGWTFNLSHNTVLTCPLVRIEKEVALVYEGLQAGAVACQ
jgi:hypothetical protein